MMAFNFKHWRKVLQLLGVLIGGYFLAMLFANFSGLKLNNTNVKFLILMIILFLAIIKSFDFKNRYLKFKKKHFILLLAFLFAVFNGVGSSGDFIPKIGVLDYEIIAILEVLFGFSISISVLFLTIITTNTMFQKYITVDTLKLNTGISVVAICITLCLMVKQMLY